MSEEVKRPIVMNGSEVNEMVFAADYDRIVSSLTEAGVRMQAERDKWQQEAIRIAVAVCALGKMEFDQLTDDSKLIEVMSVIREAIQERNQLAERCRELEAQMDGIAGDGALAEERCCGLLSENAALRSEVERLATVIEDNAEAVTLRAEVERLRELLRLAGIVAQTARVIVGGADFTTGAQIRPCGIYDIASAAERLRDALDEYDRAVIESSMDRSVK